MQMMKHWKVEGCDAKDFWRSARVARLALATLCSRFPVGSVRVARRATATVESLQLIASTDLVRRQNSWPLTESRT